MIILCSDIMLSRYCSSTERFRDMQLMSLYRLCRDIVRLLTKLAPPVNAASEQYKFSLCKEEESESLSAFLARIKDTFGDQFQNMVRNIFICGIRSSGIRMQPHAKRRRLLIEYLN